MVHISKKQFTLILTRVSSGPLVHSTGRDRPLACDGGTYGRGDTKGSSYVSDICHIATYPPLCHVCPVYEPSGCIDSRKIGGKTDT